MINAAELEEIFSKSKDIKISKERIRTFHKSIPRSVILANAGWRAMNLLEKLEEEWQWPVLKEIDDPGLDIYKGADPALLNEFINSIRDEKQVRSSRRKFKGHDRERMLRLQVRRRLGLYQDIFNFTDKDVKRCERAGRRLAKLLEKKRENFLKGVKTAGVVGAATGAGLLVYALLKSREEGKKDKK